MGTFHRILSTTAAALLLSAGHAVAGDYKVTTIDNNGTFVGCLAQNETAGVGFLAVGSSVVLFGNSTKFPIAAGDAVSGKWSVDGKAPLEFSSKADSAHTATLDVPNTTEAVTALTTGQELVITANGTQATFSLTGASQAFTDLIACMQTQKAP